MESGKSLVHTDNKPHDLIVVEPDFSKHFSNEARPPEKLVSWWKRWVVGQTFCMGGHQHQLRTPLYDPFAAVYRYEKAPESAAFALVDPDAIADPAKVEKFSWDGDGHKVTFTNGWKGTIGSQEGWGNDGTPSYYYRVYVPGLLWRWLYRPIAPVNALAKPE